MNALSIPTRRHFLRQLGVGALSATIAPRLLCAQASTASAVIDDYVRQHNFQGVVALARNGKMAFSRTIGFADMEAKTPMKIDTVFGIASISKMLTAVTVLKLVERGLLSLDQPITTYLPNYRKDTGSRLTLRHLMANDSGLPNLFSPAWKADPTIMDQPLPTAEAVKRYAEGDLIFAPGERFDYSLSNWIVVLAVVEAVTGRDFETVVRNTTLTPLGLTATTSRPDNKVAVPYTDAAPYMRKPAQRQAYVAAAGGYYSNAPDLMRAAQRIFGTPFLAPSSLQALTTILVPSAGYALGGRIREVAIGSQKVKAAWDTGNTSGYRSVLGHRLDGKGTVVVLNNTSMSQKTLDEFSDALLTALDAGHAA